MSATSDAAVLYWSAFPKSMMDGGYMPMSGTRQWKASAERAG